MPLMLTHSLTCLHMRTKSSINGCFHNGQISDQASLTNIAKVDAHGIFGNYWGNRHRSFHFQETYKFDELRQAHNATARKLDSNVFKWKSVSKEQHGYSTRCSNNSHRYRNGHKQFRK